MNLCGILAGPSQTKPGLVITGGITLTDQDASSYGRSLNCHNLDISIDTSFNVDNAYFTNCKITQTGKAACFSVAGALVFKDCEINVDSLLDYKKTHAVEFYNCKIKFTNTFYDSGSDFLSTFICEGGTLNCPTLGMEYGKVRIKDCEWTPNSASSSPFLIIGDYTPDVLIVNNIVYTNETAIINSKGGQNKTQDDFPGVDHNIILPPKS